MWARKFSKCAQCYKTDIPHKALGFCKTCYEKSKGYIWQKTYRARNLETIRIRQRVRNKKSPNVHGLKSIKSRWMKRLIERDGEKCGNCGNKENLTLEHIIPQCVGGKYEEDNLRVLCLNCNIKTYHKLVKDALRFYFQNKKPRMKP